MLRNNLIITLSIFFICQIIGCANTHTPDFDNIDQEETFELMVDVFEYEIESFSTYSNTNTWPNSTFFIGVMAAYEKTGFESFLTESYNWAKFNSWRLGNRQYNADDQAVAQVYIQLYNVFGANYMIKDFLSEAECMISTKPPRSEELLWWWADALFMAPPALIDLAKITNNNEFLNYTYSEWENTYNSLYNKEDSLFYRDKKYDNHVNKSGKKIYWLRGNGWVVAGLAKMLNTLSSKDPFYQNYRKVYLEMIKKLIGLQSDDGLWRSDLLRPQKYPVPDTSGSAFICYALGWGVNNNVLKNPIYHEAFLKSWKALKSKVSSSGKLKSVQPVGHRPVQFSPNNSEVFGSGAFLLAASEFYQYKANN